MSRKDAVSMEAMRQEIDELNLSLANRYRELDAAEDVRQMLEDALEDANSKIDDIHRKMDKLGVDVEEADYRREEAEKARKQVQDALFKFKTDVEKAKAADLRDTRMSSMMNRPLDIQNVTASRASAWVWGIVIGVVFVFGSLELLSIQAGHGELVSYLLR